ncbi:MAG: hypothetical protein KTR21_01765 [Rhodobacteraceae bacterium]|nr:hypothetical protein [Paracoccaceae bacterium]
MLLAFLEAYVLAFAVLLPAMFVLLAAIGALGAGFTHARTIGVSAGLAAFFGLWFALASAMAKTELLMPPPTLTDPPYVLMLMIGGALTLWGLARFTADGRAITGSLDQSHLIGFQMPRVMGGVFLIGWALGAIPWQFAIPAGLGDIWAGVAAYQAMQAVRRGDADADRQVLRANIIGLADFVIAVTTGLITSEGFLHLLSQDAPNIINHYPLALFPGFFVAMFTAAHFISLSRLYSDRTAAQPA